MIDADEPLEQAHDQDSSLAFVMALIEDREASVAAERAAPNQFSG